MSRESRQALTQEMLDRIDAVVSGHEHQHSSEWGMQLLPSLPVVDTAHLEARLLALRPHIDEFWAAMRRFGDLISSPSMQDAIQRLSNALRASQRPVPAKAAHKRKFGRG